MRVAVDGVTGVPSPATGGWRARLGAACGLDRSADVLPWLVCACCGVGLVMVYSAGAIDAERDPRIGDAAFFLRRQAAAVALGLAALLVGARLPLATWRRIAPFALALGWALLVAVLVPGISHAANGARRWVRIAGFGFQPSDFARVALVATLAGAGAARLEGRPRAGVAAWGALLTTVGLIVVEPDVGTATATLAVAGVMCWVAGFSGRRLACAAVICLPLAAVAVYQAFPHVRARVGAFVSGDAGLAAAHQVRQSLLALGAGGMGGVGLGAGRQKLRFLPEESTDFILAEVGEELGFVGTGLLCLCYAAFLLHGCATACRARDPFGALLATGATLLVTTQAAVNVAVVTGLAPTKGIPLPFVSAGGSSTVAFALASGALIAVARANSAPPVAPEAVRNSPGGTPAAAVSPDTASLPAVDRVAAFDAEFEEAIR